MSIKLKFYLETHHPIASDSYDYLYPYGAIRDNFRNPKFNQKLYHFPGAVLDLGCAGGGFVKNCLEDQREAVGLEGNDFNQKNNRFEWITIPGNLFTCDITKPFTVHVGDKVPYSFGIVTAWEVLEHILKKDLSSLFANIHRHLSLDGLFIASVTNFPSPNPKFGKIDMHRTLEDQDWWLNQLSLNGFEQDETIEHFFDGDWVRNEHNSYHLVLRQK